MSELIRTWHWTDESVNVEERTRKRTLGNWINYLDHEAVWHPTEWVIKKAPLGATFEDLDLGEAMPLTLELSCSLSKVMLLLATQLTLASCQQLLKKYYLTQI